MRKSVIIVFLFMSIFLLTSCALRGPHMAERLLDDSAKIADDKIKSIIEALENSDKEAMKSLFSQRAINEAENFDGNILELFDFFQGPIISYSSHLPDEESGENVDGTGNKYRYICTYFEVETDEQKYRLAFKMYIEDTSDYDNVGIYSLYIIRSEYFDPQKVYWGDGNWTPGIIIDKTKYVSEKLQPASQYNAIDQGEYVFYIYQGAVYSLNNANGETNVLYKLEKDMKGIEPDLYVDENYVYFSVCNSENTQDICRVCKDGTGFEKLINIFDVAAKGEIYHSYLVDKGWIYIQMGWELYRYHIDTGESEMISEYARIYEVYDNFLYYGDGSSIWKIDLTNGKRTDLYHGGGKIIDTDKPIYKHFTVFEGGICYFTRNPAGLYYCRDGKTELISDSETINDFSAFEHNGDIYFVDSEHLLKFSPDTGKTKYILDCPDYFEGGKIINNRFYYQDYENHYYTAETEVQHWQSYLYTEANGGVILRGYNGDSHTLILPDKINGKDVKAIGKMAFHRNTTLQSITLPKTLEEIGDKAFFKCSSLYEIKVSEENPNFTDIDGVLYSKDKTKLCMYPEGRVEEIFYIPDMVETISSSAFGYHPLCKKFFIPSSVINFPYNGLIYNDEIELIVQAGSIGEAFAVENNMKYTIGDGL